MGVFDDDYGDWPDEPTPKPKKPAKAEEPPPMDKEFDEDWGYDYEEIPLAPSKSRVLGGHIGEAFEEVGLTRQRLVMGAIIIAVLALVVIFNLGRIKRNAQRLSGSSAYAHVISVSGNELELKLADGRDTLKLVGLRIPRSNCQALRSERIMNELFPKGRRLRITFVTPSRIWASGAHGNLNQAVISRGGALVDQDSVSASDARLLRKRQRSAKKHGRGLWGC